MQINNFLSTGSMKLPSGAVSADSSVRLISHRLEMSVVLQVAEDSGRDPGLPALRALDLRLGPAPLRRRSQPPRRRSQLLQPEGEEGVAALRPGWAVGGGGLQPVPVCQRAHPRAARAHPGTSAPSEAARELTFIYRSTTTGLFHLITSNFESLLWYRPKCDLLHLQWCFCCLWFRCVHVCVFIGRNTKWLTTSWTHSTHLMRFTTSH